MRFIRASFLFATTFIMAAVAFAQVPPSAQVTGAPTITVQPTSVAVTLGTRATFSVTATGNAPLKYQWYKYGGPIQGANAAKYTTPAVRDTDNGVDYYVVVTNSLGSATSNYAYLDVNDPPMIVGQPASVTVSIPSFVFFSVDAVGTGTLTYQWYKNGVAVPTANGPTCPTGPLTAADNGDKYVVIVKNAYGTATSKPAIITINSSSPTTLPIVGYWQGTATRTSAGNSHNSGQVTIAFSQPQFPANTITVSILFTDKFGSHYDSATAFLNGQGVSTVRYVENNAANYDSLVNFNGGFSSNLLSLAVTGISVGADTMYGTLNNGDFVDTLLGTASLTISADKQSLSGTIQTVIASGTLDLTRIDDAQGAELLTCHGSSGSPCAVKMMPHDHVSKVHKHLTQTIEVPQ